MSQNKKILVVDDESSIVKLCKFVLEDAGFTVRGAINGSQALKMITEELPDLVLLDVMMPGMTGIEVCRKIRSDHEANPPWIVMYTADSSDETRQNSLDAGANDLITKEIPIYDLPGRIGNYLTN